MGGGGARGAAHVGVLKVLEELNVPVDFVVGTSMGALVGGLYACGVSVREMEAWLEGADWDALFRDGPSYSELSMRRKREVREFPVPLEVGVGRRGVQLPNGLIAGQKLNATLRQLTYRAARVQDFDSLAVPFRAVATDLETGELVVLRDGDVVDALRASMSAPGVFTPYPVADRLLVDGGLVLNLPVEVARTLGADVIIAVDVGARLADRTELTTPIQLTKQVTRIMTLSGATAQWARLAPRDLLILPDLGDQGSTEFDRSLDAVAAGEAAARAVADRLAPLAVSPAAFQATLAHRRSVQDPPDRIDYVVVGPHTGRSPLSLFDRLATRPGPIDTVTLNGDIEHLYGLGIYERVDYRIVPTDAGDALEFRVREKPWGPAYLRFRLSIDDQLDGDGHYSLATHLLVPQLNDWGAELVGELEVGEIRGLRAELYQPLGVRGIAYVALGARHQTLPSDLYSENLTVGRLRTGLTVGSFELGSHIGNDVQVSARLERGRVKADRVIGPRDLEGYEAAVGRVVLAAEIDGHDDPAFPRRGLRASLEYELARDWVGARSRYDRYGGRVMVAATGGPTTVVGALYASTSGDTDLPLHARDGLGGLLLLSGYRPGEVIGNHMLFGRLLTYRSFDAAEKLFAGVSFEVGNAWEDREAVDVDDLRFSAAAAVGLRSPLGPVYIGYGIRGSGDGIVYLVAGRTL
ncbi:MAG: patatin-like phospholipase family protein [Gemmatimonadota bacterium]